jgi:predicted nucleotidyltransferase
MDIVQVLKNDDYDFLFKEKLLENRILFLTFGGSYAYGTNIETSDIDIRGVALNRKSDLIGLSNFDQFENHEHDTVIYSFNKIISLLTNCNPNVIELLGCKGEHYYNTNIIGIELRENYKLFLSKKAVHAFGGYATAQLRRLENALARDSYPQAEKEKHILNTIKNSMDFFRERYTSFEEGSFKLYVDKAVNEEYETEIFTDIDLKHYPLRDYRSMWADINNIVKDYSKLNNRNKKKDDLHLNKHAMHLVRLYLMCFDILEKEKIITYREADHDLLMNIRNGNYQKEDGTYYPEFFDMITEYEKRLDYAAKNTSLPKDPNYKKIEEFVMSVNERVVREYE